MKEGRFRVDVKKIFITLSAVTLNQLVLKGRCGCPITGSVQSQVGQVFEQLDLVRNVPAHGTEIFNIDGL